MSINFSKGAIGEAHSKLILVGEHAVVYGQPAIAIPFPLKINVEINERDGDIVIDSLLYSGTLEQIPSSMVGIRECVKAVLIYLKKPIMDISIKVTSEIPLGRGLGSSAAVATAIIRGIYAFFNISITSEELYSFVGLAESHAHGKPSGIDMMAVASTLPIYFHKNQGVSYLQPSQSLYLVVADSGKIGDTRFAVEKVKKKYQEEPEKIDFIMNRIGNITKRVKQTIISGETKALGSLFYQNHHLLDELGVSNPHLNRLVETAVGKGALGAKLTGGGMGGCIIALAADLESAKYIANELRNEGANMSWYFSTGNEDMASLRGVKEK